MEEEERLMDPFDLFEDIEKRGLKLDNLYRDFGYSGIK